MSQPKRSNSSTNASGSTSAVGVLGDMFSRYQDTTSPRLKLIDSFLMAILLTGILQFVYVLLAGTFPFNSFLSGFGSTIGMFVLTVSLRMQVDPSSELKGKSPERAFADYALCCLILFLVVINFMG